MAVSAEAEVAWLSSMGVGQDEEEGPLVKKWAKYPNRWNIQFWC